MPADANTAEEAREREKDMSEPATRRRGYGLGFCCTVAMLLLAVYVGTYYALVERRPVDLNVWDAEIKNAPFYSLHYFTDEYLVRIFAPMHLIDAKVRPNYWTIKVRNR